MASEEVVAIAEFAVAFASFLAADRSDDRAVCELQSKLEQARLDLHGDSDTEQFGLMVFRAIVALQRK